MSASGKLEALLDAHYAANEEMGLAMVDLSDEGTGETKRRMNAAVLAEVDAKRTLLAGVRSADEELKILRGITFEAARVCVALRDEDPGFVRRLDESLKAYQAWRKGMDGT